MTNDPQQDSLDASDAEKSNTLQGYGGREGGTGFLSVTCSSSLVLPSHRSPSTTDDRTREINRCIPITWLSVLINSPRLSRIDRDKLAHFAAVLLEKGGAARLDSQKLYANYGCRIWPRLAAFAVAAGLLEIDHSYLSLGGKGRGSYCKTYRFAAPVSITETAELACRWHPGRIRRAKSQAAAVAVMSPAQLYVCAAVHRLTVAPDWRNDPKVTSAGAKSLERIERGGFFCKPDKNGRLHTNLSNMAKSARPHIRLDGAPIVGVDFSALHPNLILSLSKDADERAKLAEWLAGDFYTRLIDLDFAARRAVNPRVRPMARKTAKKTFNAAVNDRVANEESYRIFGVFAAQFPKTAQLVRDLKANDYRDAACVLQRMESRLIFAEVVTALQLARVPVVSLHDALYCTPEHVETVRLEMERAAVRLLGVRIQAKAG